MKQSGYDNFPGGNLSFSLQIDQQKLNERFNWILSMFRYFQSKMKQFQDKLSLNNFESSLSPLIFQRTYQKVSQDTINKMHEERQNVYKELYNGLSKDITEKFTTAVLLEQEKRLQETRTLIIGNITASAKSMERINQENNKMKAKVNQLIKTLEQHQKMIQQDKQQKSQPIFLSEVSIQTHEEPRNRALLSQNITTGQIKSSQFAIKQVIEERIKNLQLQIQEKSNYDAMLTNRKLQNIQKVLQNQGQKLKDLYDDSSMEEYSLQKKDELLVSPHKSVFNRSVSPSIRRRRSQILQRQTSQDIQSLTRQIHLIKQNQLSIFANRAEELKPIRQKLITIQQKLSRDVKDPSEQKWLEQKVQNYIMELFNAPFDQKFSKKLNDSLNKKLLDMKFDMMSYLKQIDRRVNDKVPKSELKIIFDQFEQKVMGFKHLIQTKMTHHDTINNDKLKQVESRLSLSAQKYIQKQHHKTQIKKQICLSCREPKTELIRRRISSSSKKIPPKVLSQSFSINSYAKRFFN